MPGFGSLITGAGEGLQGYQQYQGNDLDLQQKKQQLAQILQQMNQSKQDQQAQGASLQQVAQTPGRGPQGAYTPQQQAQFANGNPAAAQFLSKLLQNNNNNAYGLQRVDQQGQNRLQQIAAQNAPASPQPPAASLAKLSPSAGTMTMSPEEQALRKKYATNPAAMYNDPAFVPARKKSLAMQSAKPAQATPTPPTAPARITGDEDYEKLPPGSHFIGPDGVMRVKPEDPNGAEFMNSADTMGSPTGPSN